MELETFTSSLADQEGHFAFYLKTPGQPAVFQANAERFSSASLIKLPILLAWAALELRGELNSDELCDLDGEPQVGGAGFARLMKARSLPYRDILLMMIATSDNLCTNLVIKRVGMERLNTLFQDELGLTGTELQRRLMDYEARERGRDNYLAASDCIRLFDLFHNLPPQQLRWIEPILLACQDTALLMRSLKRDGIHFYHKTGSIPGLLHDWGYTRNCDIFFLTQGFQDEVKIASQFGAAGQLIQ